MVSNGGGVDWGSCLKPGPRREGLCVMGAWVRSFCPKPGIFAGEAVCKTDLCKGQLYQNIYLCFTPNRIKGAKQHTSHYSGMPHWHGRVAGLHLGFD